MLLEFHFALDLVNNLCVILVFCNFFLFYDFEICLRGKGCLGCSVCSECVQGSQTSDW